MGDTSSFSKAFTVNWGSLRTHYADHGSIMVASLQAVSCKSAAYNNIIIYLTSYNENYDNIREKIVEFTQKTHSCSFFYNFSPFVSILTVLQRRCCQLLQSAYYCGKYTRKDSPEEWWKFQNTEYSKKSSCKCRMFVNYYL